MDICQIPEERITVPRYPDIPCFAWEGCAGNMAGSDSERVVVIAFEDNGRDSGRRNREFSDRASRFRMIRSHACGKTQPCVELNGLVMLHEARFQNRERCITEHARTRDK